MSELTEAIFGVLLRYHGRLPEHEIDNLSLREVLGPSLAESACEA